IISHQCRTDGRCTEYGVQHVEREQKHPALAAIENYAAADFEERREIADHVAAGACQKEGSQYGQKGLPGEEERHAGSPSGGQQRRGEVSAKKQETVELRLPGEIWRPQQAARVSMEALRVAHRPALDLPATRLPGCRCFLMALGAIYVSDLPAVNREP